MNLKAIVLTVALALSTGAIAKAEFTKFPDGSDVPAWFNDAKKVDVNKLGKKYVITDHGVVRDQFYNPDRGYSKGH